MAANYLANLARHPSNQRLKNSFYRLANRPTPSEVPSILPTDATVNCTDRPEDGMVRTWMPALRAGFNLLLCGFGSKIQLLDTFVKMYCEEEVMVLRAYKKDASINGFLEAVAGATGFPERQCKAPVPFAARLSAHLKKRGNLLILAVHQIDGMALRSDHAQEALSILAKIPSVRLICSCEHVNTAALWSPAQQASFAFVLQDCTTYDRYSEELAVIVDGPAKTGRANRATVQSLKAVIKVLPRAAQLMYRILAEHQLQFITANAGLTTASPNIVTRPSDQDDDEDEEPEYDDDEDDEDDMELQARKGLPYHDWYNRCHQQLVIASEPAFRQQLAEFVDHHLAVGVESPSMAGLVYFLPFVRKELSEIIAFLA